LRIMPPEVRQRNFGLRATSHVVRTLYAEFPSVCLAEMSQIVSPPNIRQNFDLSKFLADLGQFAHSASFLRTTSECPCGVPAGRRTSDRHTCVVRTFWHIGNVRQTSERPTPDIRAAYAIPSGFFSLRRRAKTTPPRSRA
jgi:hypothetical protein